METIQSWHDDIRRHAPETGTDEFMETATLDFLDAPVAGSHWNPIMRNSGTGLVLGFDGRKLCAMDDSGQGFVGIRDGCAIHCNLIASGRYMAITENGHVRLVQKFSQPGVEIVILFYCCVSLVLRREERMTRCVLGECYFRRMIDGQVVEAAGGANFCIE